MTETVSQFKARVERRSRALPRVQKGGLTFNAMAYAQDGASASQIKWVWGGIAGSEIDPFSDDSRTAAFIAAAVQAGVLKEG